MNLSIHCIIRLQMLQYIGHHFGDIRCQSMRDLNIWCTFRMDKGQMLEYKYDNRRRMYHFLIDNDCNSNIFNIFRHSRYICNRNVHWVFEWAEVERNFSNTSYCNSYLTARVGLMTAFAKYRLNGPSPNLNMPVEIMYSRLYLMEIWK